MDSAFSFIKKTILRDSFIFLLHETYDTDVDLLAVDTGHFLYQFMDP